jgi:ATP/maltotriose-dependent transcriptional regulator MalT
MIRLSMGHLLAMRGDFEAARAECSAAQAMLRDLGRSVVAASTSIDAGQVELLADDPAAAERLLRADHDELSAMGAHFVLTTVGVLLARAVLQQGRLDEAAKLAASVREAAAEDDVDSQVAWRTVLAETGSRHGDGDGALHLATEAVELSRGTDSPRLQAGALASLARVHAAAGRPDEASAARHEAAALYLAKGDRVSALAVRSEA